MKALVYTAPETVEVLDVSIPQPNIGQVRIRVSFCGICGSDIGIYAGKHPRAKAPLVLGHEFVGTIDSVNQTSGKFKVGDRVSPYPLLSCGHCPACLNGTPHVCKSLKLIGIDIDGGIAEYVCCDENVLFKIPDELCDNVAAVIEPLAVIVRSMHQARFQVQDSVVVLGAGPIGILTAIVAEQAGASRVIISDIDEARLALATEMGYEAVNSKDQTVTDYVALTTNGDGVDIVFECSGVESAILESTKICRIGGTICVTGIHKAPHTVHLQDINFKEQTMVGSRVYTMREYGQAVEYAVALTPQLEKIITNTVTLADANQVFDIIRDPNINTVKVLVDCR